MCHPFAAWVTVIAFCFSGRVAFAGCDGKECRSPSYNTIRTEVYRLYSILPRYEALLDRLLVCGAQGQIPPKDIYEDLEDIDTRVQHVGTELIMKELPPCEMQEEIGSIYRDLRELQVELRARSVATGSRDK